MKLKDTSLRERLDYVVSRLPEVREDIKRSKDRLATIKRITGG